MSLERATDWRTFSRASVVDLVEDLALEMLIEASPGSGRTGKVEQNAR